MPILPERFQTTVNVGTRDLRISIFLQELMCQPGASNIDIYVN